MIMIFQQIDERTHRSSSYLSVVIDRDERKKKEQT